MAPLALCCMSHSPLLNLPGPSQDLLDDIESALARARDFVRAYDPELVVIFSPDHYNGFFYRLMPAFCIGYAAESIGDYGSQKGRLDVPEDLARKRESYVLRVKGDSMIEEQIRDGDFVIVEDRKTADNGEMVIALVGGSDVTLKKYYREHDRVRLQPANPSMQPLFFDPGQVQIQGVVVGMMRKY